MDPLAPLIDRLHAQGRLRVWSLIITVFGDSVQPRGGQIATARLARLLGRIGVEQGALRTALSRLSRDGWLTGQRTGRTSAYRLTEQGRITFIPATARIYAPPRPGPVTLWAFDPTPDGPGLPLAGGRLIPADTAPAATGLRLTGTLSGDLRAEIAGRLDPAHLAALSDLAEDLTDLAAPLPDPLTAAAARTLLIHRWRRIVLRWPELPAELLPAPLAPRDLHAEVALAYARLSPQADHWLETQTPDLPALPPADPAAQARFARGPQTEA